MNKDQLLHEKLSELESGKPVAEDSPGIACRDDRHWRIDHAGR